MKKIVQFLATMYLRYPFPGYGRLNHIMSLIFGSHQIIKSVNGYKFSFDLYDPYWNLLMVDSFHYEPEVECFLAKELNNKPIFIDCGANYGFWTLYAAVRIGAAQCIAIEASPTTFSCLKRNVGMNEVYPRLINSAVASTEGQLVGFATKGKNHAGAAISGLKQVDSPNIQMVTTMSLGSLIGAYGDETSYLIKLDVEGAEIEAISGLKEWSESARITIIYEELSPTCEVTEFLLSGIVGTWHITSLSADGETKQISINQARLLAQNTRGPINLVASNY